MKIPSSMVGALLLLLSWCLTTTASYVSIAGTELPAPLLAKVLAYLEERAQEPPALSYRTVTAQDALNETLALGASAHMAVVDVLPATTPADFLQLPFAMHTASIYVNLPLAEGSTWTFNDSCMLGKIFSGEITNWNDAIGSNILEDADQAIKLIIDEDLASEAQNAIREYIDKECPEAWPSDEGWAATAATLPDAEAVAEAVRGSFYTIACLPTAVGSAYLLPEAALDTGSGPMVASDADAAAMAAAVAAQLPATFNGTLANISATALDVPGAWPLTMITWAVVAQNLSSFEESGAWVQALLRFLYSDEVQGDLLPAAGLLPLPATANITAAIDGLELADNVAQLTFEDNATMPVASSDISSLRTSYLLEAISALQSEVATLRAEVDRALPDWLHGSGTWALGQGIINMQFMMLQRSSSPLWIEYRAIGSFLGEEEFIGKAEGGYEPYVEFLGADTPLSQANYALLQNASIGVMHLPAALVAHGFLYNLPGVSRLQLSPCTLAGIMQRTITMWDAMEIQSDNPNITLPHQNITVYARTQDAVGTAIMAHYLNANCVSGWMLSNASNCSESGCYNLAWPNGTMFNVDHPEMIDTLHTTPYAFSYGCGAVAALAGISEVALLVKGSYNTSSEVDVGAVATQLKESADWPARLTDSFDGLQFDILDLEQPAWPMVYMPYVVVRTNMTAAGDRGPLLVAMIQFMMTDEIQTVTWPSVGLHALPQPFRDDNLKALKNILLDPAVAPFRFENERAAFTGAGPRVFSNFSTFASTAFRSRRVAAFTDQLNAVEMNVQQLDDQIAGLNATAANASMAVTSVGQVVSELHANVTTLADTVAQLQAQQAPGDQSQEILDLKQMVASLTAQLAAVSAQQNSTLDKVSKYYRDYNNLKNDIYAVNGIAVAGLVLAIIALIMAIVWSARRVMKAAQDKGHRAGFAELT